MSEQVTVKREVEVQVDYVKCNNCSEELEFTLSSDEWGDIQVFVDKCDCEE